MGFRLKRMKRLEFANPPERRPLQAKTDISPSHLGSCSFLSFTIIGARTTLSSLYGDTNADMRFRSPLTVSPACSQERSESQSG
jgi:hypothetical protein